MTAVAALLFLVLSAQWFPQACQNLPNPSPNAPCSTIVAAQNAVRATASPTVTRAPATRHAASIRRCCETFHCTQATRCWVIGKEFEYAPGDKQEVHLISAKLGEDSKLIAKANHVSRFSVVEHGRQHVPHQQSAHRAMPTITNGNHHRSALPQRMLPILSWMASFGDGVSRRSRKTRLGDAHRFVFGNQQA